MAEYAALSDALRKLVPTGVHINVLTDSVALLRLVRGMRAGTHDMGYVLNRQLPFVKSIQHRLTDRVKLRKVKAHSGHILNEAADRLAKLGRRTAEYGLSEAEADAVAKQIVAEALRELEATR